MPQRPRQARIGTMGSLVMEKVVSSDTLRTIWGLVGGTLHNVVMGLITGG